jgi:hypothetical protein
VPLRQPRQVGARFEHLADRSPVAAEGDELDTVTPRLEHADGGRRSCVDQHARLLLAAPPEAVRRRPALLVATLDEARAHLRADELLALEDPDRVPAQPHEHGGDDMILGDRLEQRREPNLVVLRLVRESERRSRDDRLARQLDPDEPVCIGRPAFLTLERSEALAHVLASHVPGHPVRLGLLLCPAQAVAASASGTVSCTEK